MIKRALFKLARNQSFSWIIGWIFTHMSFAIPVDRIAETDMFLVFHHPRPSYNLHILLVPKRKYPDLLSTPSADSGPFYTELLQVVKQIVNQFELQEKGYRLIVNGGKYQEVPHLHFHLVSGNQQD